MLDEHIEDLASKRCCRFDRKKKEKACSCFECLRNDPSSQLAIAAHLLEFAEWKKDRRDSYLISEIRIFTRIEEELKKLGVKTKQRYPIKFLLGVSSPLFKIPFQKSDDESVNTELQGMKLCKHAFGVLYKVTSNRGWKPLEDHARNNTRPVHALKGTLLKVQVKFETEVIPHLKLFFDNDVLKICGPRPTVLVKNLVNIGTSKKIS